MLTEVMVIFNFDVLLACYNNKCIKRHNNINITKPSYGITNNDALNKKNPSEHIYCVMGFMFRKLSLFGRFFKKNHFFILSQIRSCPKVISAPLSIDLWYIHRWRCTLAAPRSWSSWAAFWLRFYWDIF